MEAKISCKPAQNFVKCSYVKFSSLSTNCSALFVGRASTFIICRFTNFSLFSLFASANRLKKHDFNVQVHERKGQSKLLCSLTRQGKNCECHSAHSFQFIIIVHWAATCLYFTNQLCALYIAFDKCFYTFDMVVVKSVYIAFLVHKEKFAFQVHALRITMKLGF